MNDHVVAKKVLFSLLDALRPYLNDIVIVGGWVPQIHAWQEEGSEIHVHSFDVDAALDRKKLPTRRGESITDLLTKKGFAHERSPGGMLGGGGGKGGATPSRFVYRKGKVEVPVEFIAPQRGSGKDIGVNVQRGFVVQALRYTDIALETTLEVELKGEDLDGVVREVKFKVPTLAAYVYAKGLIYPKREEVEKRGKDLAYIYEILKRENWRDTVSSELPVVIKRHHPKWGQTFRENIERDFEDEGAAGPTWLAMQYPGEAASELKSDAVNRFKALLARV